MEPIFQNLTADDPETTEIESLCLDCGENGTTRLLLTKIPFFKEIIIMSFSCPHCGCSNNETQFGGKTQERGVKVKLLVENEKDLNRQVVKSDYTSIFIPELEFEIPGKTQKGAVITVEGIIDRAVAGLEQDQAVRKISEPDAAEKIDEFIKKMTDVKKLRTPFHLILDDPSGNSFIENLCAPLKDRQLDITNYVRSTEQDTMLGLTQNEEEESPAAGPENLSEEVLSFQTNCSNCNAPCDTHMKVTKIPHFKEAVIMATNCDVCGTRTNEVKSGAGVEPKGRKISLHITKPEDMHRDVLKSETCGIVIPELEFEVGPAALGGRFSTVEGILTNIKEQLSSNNPFIGGDSAQAGMTAGLDSFVAKIDQVISNKLQIHFILDDPAGNSYLQSLCAPDPDPCLEVTEYERTFDQNDELGLNDMKTENYET